MRSSLAGLFLGTFLSVAPFELLLLAIPAALIFCRWSVLVAAALIVTIAYRAPLKYLDRELDSLPRVSTVRELARRERMLIDAALLDRTISLPRARMTRRDLAAEVARQTGTELRVSYCAVGATILRGSHAMSGLRFVRPAAGKAPYCKSR